MTSRFCFNISTSENLKNIYNIISFKEKDFENDLKDKMLKIYKNPNLYFFDYGRTAFFEILFPQISIFDWFSFACTYSSIVF